MTAHTAAIATHSLSHCWAEPVPLFRLVARMRVITDIPRHSARLFGPWSCASPNLSCPGPLASPSGPSLMQFVLRSLKERLSSSSQQQQHCAGERSAAQHGACWQERTLVCRDYWHGWT